jgi:hypothetical protein
MAQAAANTITVQSRRAFLAVAAAAVVVALPLADAGAGIGGPDPDAVLVAAWEHLQNLEHQARDNIGDIPDAMTDAIIQMENVIAYTPCHGVNGVIVKLRLLDFLCTEGNSVTDWQGPLIKSILAVLPAASLA